MGPVLQRHLLTPIATIAPPAPYTCTGAAVCVHVWFLLCLRINICAPPVSPFHPQRQPSHPLHFGARPCQFLLSFPPFSSPQESGRGSSRRGPQTRQIQAILLQAWDHHMPTTGWVLGGELSCSQHIW